MKAGAVAGVTLTFVPILFVVVLGGGSEQCGPGGSAAHADAAQVSLEGLPVESVAGYSGEQLVNAAHVMNAAQQLGLPLKAQVIGVMTAMGESGLRVLDHGDAVGPDSRGLFQQRDNGAWGSYADRMDPTTSALNFFRALQGVEGWEDLEPTIAAHRVQRNADPQHYVRWWEPATQVVAALSGVELDPSAPSGEQRCVVYAGGGDGAIPAGYAEPGPWGGHSNGYIPAGALTPIPWAPGYALRQDATAALVALNNAYRAEFGRNMHLSSAYRDYATQVYLKATKGGFAATPGTSNHGWGLAVDLGDGVDDYGTATYVWMMANAPSYGWINPPWARQGGSGADEPWHWEFYGVADDQPA